MELFVFVFFGYILLQIFSGFVSPKSKKAKPYRALRPQDQSPQAEGSGQNTNAAPSEWADLNSRLKSISAGQAKTFGRRQAEMRARLEAAKNTESPASEAKTDGPIAEPRDINDRNRARRSDWGARAGPGLLSTQNLLIGVVFVLILYLIIQIFGSYQT